MLPSALMGVAFFVIAKWIPDQQATGKVSRADFSALARLSERLTIFTCDACSSVFMFL